MSSTIEFWMSPGSPSAYLASLRIEDIAEKNQAKVRWRPFNILKALEVEGIQPNVIYDRKGAYTKLDWERTARFYGHPYTLPNPFGGSSIPAMTIAYWAEMLSGQEALKTFLRNVMKAYFVENRALDDPQVLAHSASESGLDADDALVAIDDPAPIEMLEKATQEAVDNGVWGAPFMIVDGEPFWGEDRLDQLDLWMQRGGW